MRLAPALAFAAVLGFAAPASAVDPDPWLSTDKALHFGVSAGIAGLGYGGAALLWDDVGLRLGVGASVAVTAGIAKELFDLAGYGTPSWKDFAWDLLGTAVGLALAFGIDRLFFAHPQPAPAPPAAQARRPAPALLDSPFAFAPIHSW
ncbi:MAG TPA: hypothetical protein VGK67_40385 [Myxococcales bacterium]|jgi:putative lipoprotein